MPLPPLDPDVLQALPACVLDPARLSTLHTYAVDDGEGQAAFDDIAALARSVCAAPIGLVSFVEADRQWFKGADGTPLRQTPIATSICAYTLDSPAVLVVPDTLADPRFAAMDVVVNHGVRFYAGAPLRTSDGVGLGALCVLDTVPRTLDDTQRDLLQRLAGQVMRLLELRRGLAQSERALFAHRRIMAVAGHDLGNPLMRVELALFAMERRVAADDGIRPDLAVARGALHEVAGTLRRLAHASLLDQSRVALAPVTVEALFADLAERWTYIAEDAGRTLVLKPIAADLLTSAALVLNVLDNLVGNALKHGRQGAITIEAGTAPRGIWLAVSDEGPGIPEDQRKRIFDALVQVGEDRTGLGLGLSIVQRTAELLGAEVSVRANAGKGARFILWLPERHRDAGPAAR